MVYALDISNSSVNPLAKFSTVATMANLIIPLLIGFGAALTLIMALMGAYSLITSAGDPEKYKKAQQTFKFALIGFFVVFTSFLIIKLIEFVLHIDLPI